VRVLLAALACVFLTGAFAQTPEERLFEAIEDDKPLVAEGIVARGKVNLDARNKDRETALHRAIEKGYKELAAMLVRAGAPLGALTQTGETPLHYAALYAETDFMELLLDGKPGSKADVRARNDDGESVLQWAVMSGNAATARLLLERGADPKAVDLKGNTLLHAAADGGYAALASAFLGLGVDPRQRNREGKRPIQIGRERGHAEIVKLLERFEKE